MGVSGYNSPGSGTWHSKQACSGTVFSAAEAMDSKVAENRRLSPCGNCCDGEWPHADETADRDPDAWIEKLEPSETALKFTEPSWRGPEYIGADSEGGFNRWPVGFGRNVGDTTRRQIVDDLGNPDIEVETVDWSETPLAEEEEEEA